MSRAIAGPALMVVGGVLVLVSMVFDWVSVTLSWHGQVIDQGLLRGSPIALFGACILILAGFVLARSVTARRTSYAVLAIIAAGLVELDVVLVLQRNYGISSLAPEGQLRNRIQEWIAQGASLTGTRSPGLFVALAGGALGMVGGVLAFSRPRTLAKSLPGATTA
jgi:hypothetical protein